MRDIKMNTSRARSVCSHLNHEYQEMTRVLSRLNRRVHSVDRDWMGSSASEFQRRFDQVYGGLRCSVEDIESNRFYAGWLD